MEELCIQLQSAWMRAARNSGSFFEKRDILHLDYESKCSHLHGHNWIITVTCQRETLDANGMVVDFTKIKETVNQLDHVLINDVVGNLNPTAENMAKWICDRIPYCVKVSVEETEGNVAVYEK